MADDRYEPGDAWKHSPYDAEGKKLFFVVNHNYNNDLCDEDQSHFALGYALISLREIGYRMHFWLM